MSHTFHGRDLFAPVAAHLSLGVRPEKFGPEVDEWIELDFTRPKITGKRLLGEIIHIDAFGNLITNITKDDLSHFAEDRAFVIRIGKVVVKELKKGYWEVEEDELMALIGSGGFLEISVREGNAQKMLKIKKGDRIIVSVVSDQ